jgi:hypothetical protein
MLIILWQRGNEKVRNIRSDNPTISVLKYGLLALNDEIVYHFVFKNHFRSKNSCKLIFIRRDQGIKNIINTQFSLNTTYTSSRSIECTC